MYKIEIDENFLSDFKKLLKENKKFENKINTFINEVKEHPETGTGKPEPLKHFKDEIYYSRRISKKHRFVYKIDKENLLITLISCYGHYK